MSILVLQLDESAIGKVKHIANGKQRPAKETRWVVGVLKRKSKAVRMIVVGDRRLVP
jgi:hypothetical protein